MNNNNFDLHHSNNMFKKVFNNLHIFYRHFATETLKQSNNLKNNQWARRSIFPLLMTTYPLMSYSSVLMVEQQKSENLLSHAEKQAEKQKKEGKKNIVQRLWRAIIHIVRFFHLLLIFSPPILLSPLLFFEKTRDYWRDVLVKAVERAGVVFIKAFQYLSHRRDIIGPEMGHKFQYLRENAPTHSFETTKKYFKQLYNKNISDIFEEFQEIPIASGSVSQVYRARYKGKKVAVKVRHPNVDKYIQRDVNLMFFLSYLASFFSPAMEIPVSQASLKRTLTEQIDFTFQMQNLNRFNKMFKQRHDVNFPFPFEQNTKDAVLIQTYVEGVPVTYYQKVRHPLNKVIARLGSTTFFQMLMKNNFIHADCHGGNILIEIREKSYSWFTQICDYIREVGFILETKLKSLTFDTEKMKKMYTQSRQQQISVRKLLRKYKQEIIVNLIDVGMVIELTDRDKKNFVNFIKSLIEGKGQVCAQMIYNLSNFQGKKIIMGKFQSYYDELMRCFSALNNNNLDAIQGMDIFMDMLTIIRQNRMKLDGQFATLLTNMIVLQAIAKDIDPQIKILKCAFPYFKYVDDKDLIK